MDSVARRILVVEDNRVLLDVLRFNLERGGFDVTTALNGNLAVEQLRQANFDLLITDIQMPGLNGEELCRFVRSELQLLQLPILMCSAKGFELDIDFLKRTYGISDVIYKPFSVRSIVAKASELTSHPACSPA